MFNRFNYSLLALAIFSAQASAQDITPVGDTVLVTGTRTIEGQDPSMVANTVITRADIERIGSRSVGDLLQATAGVTTTSLGGMGKESSMFMRGTESDHVLFLIDGVRVGSATAGKEAFQDLPLDLIERIEIVRGPFSSLYGSDAIGGVVQIFTRKETMGVRPNFSATIGSNDYRNITAGVSGRSGKVAYGINASHRKTDGLNACRGSAVLFAGCYTDEFDRDGYENQSMNANLSVDWTDQISSTFTALALEGKNKFDGSYTNESRVSQDVFGMNTKWRVNPHATMEFKLGHGADESIDSHDGVYVGTVSSKRQSAGLQAQFDLSDAQRLVVGWDFLRDRIGGDTGYAVLQRHNRAGYAQWSGRFADRHDLQLNVRRDDNSQFGGKTTGSALWGIALDSRTKLTFSAGTAFKAPSFNELYYPYYGNPLLRPETARNIEIGLSRKSFFGTWSVNVFQNQVDDLIAHDASIPPFGAPNNIDKARIRGAEFTHKVRAGDLQLSSAVTFLSAKQEGGLYDGKLLPRRAKQSARIDADYPLSEHVRAGGSFIGMGHRYDELSNSTRLAGYGRLDLRTSFALNPSWRLDLGVENVFDRDYETAAWYVQPGREWMLTLRYSQ